MTLKNASLRIIKNPAKILRLRQIADKTEVASTLYTSGTKLIIPKLTSPLTLSLYPLTGLNGSGLF